VCECAEIRRRGTLSRDASEKRHGVAFATPGFLVFVTLQPWIFKLLFPIFAIFYYGNRNARFSDGRKTGWAGSKSRPNSGQQKNRLE
jgi:hypothetical protein